MNCCGIYCIMASKRDVRELFRLGNYLRQHFDELEVPIARENDIVLWRRLETRANQFRKGQSWKKVQALLEAEAISKVAVKEHIQKLLSISQELSEMTGIMVDEVVVLLLRLFMQEPLNSALLKQIVKHVFGLLPSSVFLHRISQIAYDIATVLPAYTQEALQEKQTRSGLREELFGRQIKFVSLERNKIELPNVPQLNDIIFLSEEEWTKNLLIEDYEDKQVQESEQQNLSGYKFPARHVRCLHIDNGIYEEVKLYTPRMMAYSNCFISVSELGKVGKRIFKNSRYLNDVDAAAFHSVFSSNENVVIALPLGFDKTNVILMAILNLLTSSSCSTHQFKVLYFVESKAAADRMALKLQARLASLGIVVRSFTACKHFNKAEVDISHVLVTTVNTWKVLTRTTVYDQISDHMRLLIIDEMNWLQEKNGPALEIIIARITRQVKCGGSVRKIGFTMSLLTDCTPTFSDMASFLQVDADNALKLSHYSTTILPNVVLVRMNAEKAAENKNLRDEICCTEVNKAIYNDRKVVVFVNSESEAVHTAETIRKATDKYQKSKFILSNNVKNKLLEFMPESAMEECRNLCLDGYLIIHPGMTTCARNFVSYIFRSGITKLIVVTSNFAWMLSNQVDTIIIKETDIYSEESGSFVDIGISSLTGMLSVATFPQKRYAKICGGYVTIICCSRFKEYVTMFQNHTLVESQLMECLPECLNAEIVLGNVSSENDCIEWFKCTYLYCRIRSNFLEVKCLDEHVQTIVTKALQVLEKAGMIRYLRLGNITATELGYIASCHDMSHTSMTFIGKCVRRQLKVNSIVDILIEAPVLSQIQVKKTEVGDLADLENKFCKLVQKSETCSSNWKTSILLLTHICDGRIESSELKRDQSFIVKKVTDLARAMFDVHLSKKNAIMTDRCLQVVKIIEKCGLSNCHVETKGSPKVELQAFLQPISETVFQVMISITPAFIWKEELYKNSPLQFWLWIEDSKINLIYNYKSFKLTKKVVETKTCIEVVIPIRAVDPLPDYFKVCVVSDKWSGIADTCNVMFQQVSLPNIHITITGLLDLRSLPVSILQKDILEQMYSFRHFGAVITQAFHSLYHSDRNIFLAVSSSKQKIIAAEIAIFRAMFNKPGSKAVYLTAWKTEVKDRLTDWQSRFKSLWKVESLSGNISEDMRTFFNADIVVATTHHWEVMSRMTEILKCLTTSKVSVIIVDELQVMNVAMETVISRARSPAICNNVRVIGLSRATLAYANDVACSLGIPRDCPEGIYNFHNLSNSANMSITGVQVVGFIQKHYSARMMLMSQAVWDAIKEHLQPGESVVVLVPTRKQALLTAQALKGRLMNCSSPRLQCKEEFISVHDGKVRTLLKHGIGLLHCGMSGFDFTDVQNLALSQKIRVVITSMDAVDEVRLRSHLVIVKGTEKYDISTENYIDIPVSEISDMIYSCSSCWKKAIILTQDSKKVVFQTYFQGALLVESRLLEILPDYLNNEIVGRTVTSKSSALEHLSLTYLGQRLASNPSYYLGPFIKQSPQDCLSLLIEKSLCSLGDAGCVTLEESGQIQPTLLGSLSSCKNLSHGSVKCLSTNLKSVMTQKEMLLVVCETQEFKQLPSRINDSELVSVLERHSRWNLDHKLFLPLVIKVFMLLQSHFASLENQMTNFVDYVHDLKVILAPACRITQAAVVICSEKGWLRSALQAQLLLQMLVVGRWADENALFCTLTYNIPNNLNLCTSLSQKTVPSSYEHQDLSCRHHGASFTSLNDKYHLEEKDEIHKSSRNELWPNIQLSLFDKIKHWRLKDMYEEMNNGRRQILLSSGKEYTLSAELVEADISETCQMNESWTLILGLKEELLVMKSVKPGTQEVLLSFKTPSRKGKMTYTLYVMSDSHIGLDQQYDIPLKIV